MDAPVFVVQCAIAIPIILGLVVYTMTRWDRTPLHQLLVVLLASIVPWLLGMVIKMSAVDPAWRLFGLHLEQLSIIAMPPIFLLAMGQFARVGWLELGRPFFYVVVSLPVLFAGLYLSDRLHGLYFMDLGPALDGERPQAWGGPLYWAWQVWAALQCWSAVLCLGLAVWRGRTRGERRRAWMVLGAVFLPVFAHAIYLAGLQPIDYSLAPLTLGLTAVLFVYGVEAHGVLAGQPIVRTDVIEHLRDALVLADAAGSVLDANAAAEATLGSDRRALRGRPLSEVLAMVLSPEDAAGICDQIDRLAPGEGRSNGEVSAPDGRVFEVTAASVRAQGSLPAGVFLSLRDRTEQRRNERLLREQQKLESVGILAAGVAHEVNNPLAFVRANLVHLQKHASEIEKLALAAGDADPELLELPEVLAESLEGIERIGRIVEGMLRFTRAPEEAMRQVDLNEVVRESMRLADLHRDREVQVESRLISGLPTVLGSSNRLVQVMLNLFLNGKQALSGIPAARIIAETDRDETAAIVRVRDNGPGVAEADRERIFDPFFTTRGPDEGTGLGLSIAFDIVREHGGVLEVDSSVGEGTCFTIRLPIAGS